ncbi:uncharacterized protein [Dermacentor andersoni]|uniref:uncharacterized protein n=1 Tax=Dermacentor andersoni TaxID=34620 RepID=UPI002415B832|nr:uncharacterized protein LOC126540486 [Dermacentor andersoni]XP_054932034.1 uncharacterized protein LOC126540486 [Dermacentor andersoni]XP_054932035.1 uncharacterized protein LOC126540486 [Dermacentor andersoni]XP_054932036.1 uncharacterized protein LOC126540486 [Dermacentor andersoni]
MKACLWISLLSLVAVAYGASVATETAVPNLVLTKEMQAEVVQEAGKSLETLGKILQGKDVASTKEEQDEVLQVLRALTSDEALSDDAAEYIWPIIARGVVQGGVAHGVHKWLNRRA